MDYFHQRSVYLTIKYCMNLASISVNLVGLRQGLFSSIRQNAVQHFLISIRGRP